MDKDKLALLEARLEAVEEMIPFAAGADAPEHDDLEWERADLLFEIAALRSHAPK